MTEIIKDYITHKKIRYEILTGTIKSQDRPIVYKYSMKIMILEFFYKQLEQEV